MPQTRMLTALPVLAEFTLAMLGENSQHSFEPHDILLPSPNVRGSGGVSLKGIALARMRCLEYRLQSGCPFYEVLSLVDRAKVGLLNIRSQ